MALVGGKSFEEMGEELTVDESQESKVYIRFNIVTKGTSNVKGKTQINWRYI